MIELLSSCDPRDFVLLSDRAGSPALRRVLRFYVPASKDELLSIWSKGKAGRANEPEEPTMPDDERVEDAGLDFEDELDHANRAVPQYDGQVTA